MISNEHLPNASQLRLSNKPELMAIVDCQTYQYLCDYSWLLLGNGYCGRYVTTPNGRSVIYLHHEVAKLSGLAGVGRVIDHINGNVLDNRALNLRPATQSQNMCNRDKPRSNTSGFKGVSFHPATGKWRACIRKDYRQHHLGLYSSPLEAAQAYNRAAVELHGEFAFLNQI